MFPPRRALPRLSALLLFSWCSFCPCGEAAAGADSRQPYQLTVVLHFTDNRQLTPLFRQQVERELRDGLQAAYGDLARVDVTTRHPRLGRVLEVGLGRLGEALAGWDDAAARAAKTHFVLFDFAGGEYQIQARQFDGPTGQPSPVVRTDHKPNALFVARAAALLVDRDFGLAGTFPAWPRDAKGQPGAVTLELQGAGLGVPLSRWVKKGDVFSVVQMPLGPGAGRPVPFALVQVETPPRDDDPSGACAGRLFWRYQPPADSGGGYRCLRLGAGKETLRLRLVTLRPGAAPEPARNVGLEVRRNGFTGEGQPRMTDGVTDTVSGSFTPRDPAAAVFDRVAFVTVLTPRANVPVPLLDDRPVVIPVEAVQGAGSLIALKARYWALGVAQSWLVHANGFADIGKLAEERKRDDAVTKAKECLARTRDDVVRLERERDALAAEAGEAGDKLPDLSAQEKLLKQLQKGEGELREFLERQDALDKEENSPAARTAKEQVESGKLLERQLEVGKAIEAYEKAIEGGVDDPKLREHVDKLKAQWQTKGAKHEEARRFIYEVWPKLDTEGLARQMKTAVESFEECKRAGDVIGPRKLELEIGKHAARLEDEFGKLRADIIVGREKEAERIKEVSAGLAKLAQDVAQYLGEKKPAAAPAPAPAPAPAKK